MTDEEIRTLVVNMKTSPYDVYIGRGSIWGNPFSHVPSNVRGVIAVPSRAIAIAQYEAWLHLRPRLLERLPELRGKRLGCYCAPQPCHGYLLARLANRPLSDG